MEEAIANRDLFTNDVRYALTFDPQTAGGLLASVPRENSEAAVSALHDAGYYGAAVIGGVNAPATDVRRLILRST